MIEHHSQIDALLKEFDSRNPNMTLIVRYTMGLEEAQGYVVEVTTPEDRTDASEITIDPVAPVGIAGGAIARCLGVIEAGYDADEEKQAEAIEHYLDYAELFDAVPLVKH